MKRALIEASSMLNAPLALYAISNQPSPITSQKLDRRQTPHLNKCAFLGQDERSVPLQ
jgi:hypothetical protein